MKNFKARGSILCLAAALTGAAYGQILPGAPAPPPGGPDQLAAPEMFELTVYTLDQDRNPIIVDVYASTADGAELKGLPQPDGSHMLHGAEGVLKLTLDHQLYGASVIEVLVPADRGAGSIEIIYHQGRPFVSGETGISTSPSEPGAGIPIGNPACGTGAGDCCASGGNGTPGCDDVDCCNIVCAADPFCCDTSWDGICAGEAADLCGDLCGMTGGPCDPPFECPMGALEEGEPCGDDNNGGCNSMPPVFVEAACGETWCGSAWADGDRDTDWYLVDHPGGTLTATLVSAFDGVCFIVDGIGTCTPAVVGAIGCSSGCVNIAPASAELPAGQYAVFVATGNCDGSGIFDGFPCGGGNNDYSVTIECSGGCIDDEDCPAGLVCVDGVCVLPPPTNDACEDATPIDVPSGGSADVLGSTTQATGPDALDGCGTTVTAPGVWYAVVGNGNTMTASTCNQASYDTKISVYCQGCATGEVSDCCFSNGTPGCDDPDCEAIVCAADPFCCDTSWDGICAGAAVDLCGDLCGGGAGGLTCIVGVDDTPGCGGFTTEASWCAQNGAEYLILVHGFGGAVGDFTLTVSDNGSPCVPDVECVPFVPFGACCIGSDCVDGLTQEDCEAEGGEYQGDDTSCAGGFLGYGSDSCGNPFEDISGTGIEAPTASSTDDGGDVVPLGFTFNFFGVNQTSVGVASNGYLTFGGDLSDFTNDPIPDPTDPNDLIAPWWDDWSPNQAGTVYYQTDGMAPNRRFIAQWTDVEHFGGDTGELATFQAVLYEGSNCIEYRYGDPLYFDTPTVGVENADGSDGLSIDPNTIGSGDCVVICPVFEDAISCAEPRTLIIKQGACPAPVNPGSNGVTQMVVTGEMDFDVSMVDPSSITLRRCDGIGGVVAPNDGPPGPPGVQIQDLNHPNAEPATCATGGCTCNDDQSSDGLDDLKLKFNTDEMSDVLELGGEPAGAIITLEVSGSLNDGSAFTASDCIRIVGPNSAPGALTIESDNGGIWIETSPLDDLLDGGGYPKFWRTWPIDSIVTLTAPAMAEGHPFTGWVIEIDGEVNEFSADQRTIQVRIGGIGNALATYSPLQFVNPANPQGISGGGIGGGN